MKRLTLNLLKLYQKHLAPINYGVLTCKFEPSCSHYAYQAIDKHGVLRGSLMGTWRVLRCNPLSKGGKDPVK